MKKMRTQYALKRRWVRAGVSEREREIKKDITRWLLPTRYRLSNIPNHAVCSFTQEAISTAETLLMCG